MYRLALAAMNIEYLALNFEIKKSIPRCWVRYFQYLCLMRCGGVTSGGIRLGAQAVGGGGGGGGTFIEFASNQPKRQFVLVKHFIGVNE